MINLTPHKEELIQRLVRQYDLKLVILFGSQVGGQIHRESDYDIGYLSNRQLTLREEGFLIIGFLPIIEQRDERLVNLVDLKHATPLLLYAATAEAQILYESTPTTFATLRAYAFKKYIETKPLYRLKAQRLGLNSNDI